MESSGRLGSLLASVAIALAASSARAEDVLRIGGTGTALGAMRVLAAAFEKANPGRRVRITPSVGTSGAVRAVADGALDVGLSGRELRPDELALGVVAIAYARTPFVFAVGPRNAATGITAADVVRIYRGEFQTWPDGERVRLVLRPRSDADNFIMGTISEEMRAAVDVALAREGLLVAATNQECNDLIARTPGAVGPSSLTQILTERKPVTPLSWNGVPPTVRNLASGAYPLGKTLFAVVRPSHTPLARRFLAFLGSPEARRILARTGNLPVAPAPGY